MSCCSPAGSPSSGCCEPVSLANTPELLQRMAHLLERYDVNQFAASVRVYAVK